MNRDRLLHHLPRYVHPLFKIHFQRILFRALELIEAFCQVCRKLFTYNVIHTHTSLASQMITELYLTQFK